MNKEEIITAIAEKTSFSKIDSKKFLDSYVEIVTAALKAGDSIQLIGFGNLSVTDRPEREGRNPRTGATMTIAASKAVKFAAGKTLKDTINA